TANASTGEVLDTKSLESIPTAGRSVFLMANLQPTVQASGNAHWNRMQDQVGNSAMSMGGGAVRANNYLVDGFPVTDLQNRASTNPTIEAIQDMKVQVHTYDAEMGRTGAGEKYVDNQPQNSSFLVPTAAELTGNFAGVTRSGAQVTIKDPLTGLAFPGNVIPANRLNGVGVKLASYLPTADTQIDNGNSNF